MYNMQDVYEIKCQHKKNDLLKIWREYSICFECSSGIIGEDSDIKSSAIKPLKYYVKQENSIPIILAIYDTHKSYSFLNKLEYLKFRKLIVKQIKEYCKSFNLSFKTFFLSIDYFDRICSKLMAFDLESLKQIAKFCVIFASKFQENRIQGYKIREFLGIDKENFLSDELYLLRLLDYDLVVFTSYDILIDALYCGFIFSNEKILPSKLNKYYNKIENMLYLFSENKYYIEMTYKEIALAFIGFIREMLGLQAFNNTLKMIFMNNPKEVGIYQFCLQKLKKAVNLLITKKEKIIK